MKRKLRFSNAEMTVDLDETFCWLRVDKPQGHTCVVSRLTGESTTFLRRHELQELIESLVLARERWDARDQVAEGSK